MRDAITLTEVREILRHGEYVGGVTDPECGDIVQMRTDDGSEWSIYLGESFGDAVPSDADILRTVAAVGECPGRRDDAIPVDRSAPESITATVKVKALGGYSLGVIVTRELKALGVEAGEYVKVTVERAD